MKIAIVRQRYVAHGGAERVITRFVEHLIKQGHRVTLFAHQWDQGDQWDRAIPGVAVHRVPMLSFGSFFRLVSFAFFSKRALCREPFDLIFSLERTWHQDIYRAGDGCHREWLARRNLSAFGKLRVAINPFHWAMCRIERQIFTSPRTRIIIANAQHVKDDIIRHYGTPTARIEVVYNGVDLVRFHPENRPRYRRVVRSRFGIPDEAFLVLFVGSGFERKGLSVLIQAMGIVKIALPEAAPRLLIVGGGKRERYIEAAETAGVAGEVCWAGTVKDVEQLYAAADLFVLPTRYDPFANVCLEAMATGIPVVTTRANGASELLTGPLAPFVLEDANDAPACADLIQRACRSDHALLGDAARKIAEGFSAAHCFEKWVALCEQACERMETQEKT